MHFTLPNAVQARQADCHIPSVRQYHSLATRHVHDAQLDDTGAAVFLLRIPGLGNYFALVATSPRLLPIPQRGRSY